MFENFRLTSVSFLEKEQKFQRTESYHMLIQLWNSFKLPEEVIATLRYQARIQPPSRKQVNAHYFNLFLACIHLVGKKSSFFTTMVLGNSSQLKLFNWYSKLNVSPQWTINEASCGLNFQVTVKASTRAFHFSKWSNFSGTILNWQQQLAFVTTSNRFFMAWGCSYFFNFWSSTKTIFIWISHWQSFIKSLWIIVQGCPT